MVRDVGVTQGAFCARVQQFYKQLLQINTDEEYEMERGVVIHVDQIQYRGFVPS